MAPQFLLGLDFRLTICFKGFDRSLKFADHSLANLQAFSQTRPQSFSVISLGSDL